MKFGRNLPAVRRSLLHPHSGERRKKKSLFCPEDEACKFIPYYTQLHHLKMQYSSSSLSWGSQISFKFFHLLCRTDKTLTLKMETVTLILW